MGYCKEVGLNLGQAGYQALAAGCTKEKDAMTMLDMMKASLTCTPVCLDME